MSRDAIDDERAVRLKRVMEIIFRWLFCWKASLLANTKFQEQVAFTVRLSLIEAAIHLTIYENNK